MPNPPIDHKKLVLAEGKDAQLFCIYACEALGITDALIWDFGGITQLPGFLLTTTLATGFNKVESLVIVRDAETNADAAIQSITHALRAAGLPVPDSPFTFAPGKPQTAFGIFPGTTYMEGNRLRYHSGALEDLCILTVDNPPVIECVDNFLQSVEQCACTLSHRHKSRLHSYLSVQNDFVGMKIGQAAQANAWNWQHPVMDSLRTLFRGM